MNIPHKLADICYIFILRIFEIVCHAGFFFFSTILRQSSLFTFKTQLDCQI